MPALLELYGEHCGPCRQLAPVINSLAGEYEGRARVLKVEAGANRELAGDLAVSSVPTVVAFRGGHEVGRLVGLRPESAYRNCWRRRASLDIKGRIVPEVMVFRSTRTEAAFEVASEGG